MRRRHVTLALLASAWLTLIAPSSTAPPGAGGSGAVAPFGPETLQKARDLMGAGLYAEAEAEALIALSAAPYDPETYTLLARAAELRDDPQGRLRWNKWLHWSFDYAGETERAAEIADRLKPLYADWNRDGEIIGTWKTAVLEAIADASRSKHFRTAGHMIEKLIDLNPADPALVAQYDALYAKAGEELSGGAFTAARVRRRSPRYVARQNKQHEEWADAFRRKTEHYEILTNISYEFYETLSVVMEEMFEFYQATYDYRKRAPRVTLAVHRKRSDFDKYCIEELGGSLPLNTGGWFYDKEMTVAAYDRTEAGTDLTDLYRVLFHEASHQFMYLLTESKTKQEPPTWLNEGTASYFEGCELKADGSIVKNKPALSRIREWESIERGPQKHSLKELVTCEHRGYDGSFYSYGWSLVYFLNNYEDADGKLIYRDAYLEYLKSYTKKGPKKDSEQAEEAYNRAVALFVDGIRDPEVPDWAAFEDRWRTFTQKMVEESKAGPDFADELLERCERYYARGDYERALIAAEQADDKRPDDAATYRLLALACDKLGRAGDAVYWMLRHWEKVWAAGDDEAAETARAWLGSHHAQKLADSYCTATARALEDTEAAMEAAGEAGLPVVSMLFAAHALQAFGLDHRTLLDRITLLREESGQDLRLWRHAYDGGPEANRKWSGMDVVRYDADGVLINNPEESGQPREECRTQGLAWLVPPYDVRGSVQVDGKNGAYLYLGIPNNGRAQAGIQLHSHDKKARVELETTDLSVSESGGIRIDFNIVRSRSLKHALVYPFRLSVSSEGGTFTVGEDQELELPDEFDSTRLTGRFAISAGENTAALFTDVEIRVDRPFWPVPPVEDDGGS